MEDYITTAKESGDVSQMEGYRDMSTTVKAENEDYFKRKTENARQRRQCDKCE